MVRTAEAGSAYAIGFHAVVPALMDWPIKPQRLPEPGLGWFTSAGLIISLFWTRNKGFVVQTQNQATLFRSLQSSHRLVKIKCAVLNVDGNIFVSSVGCKWIFLL